MLGYSNKVLTITDVTTKPHQQFNFAGSYNGADFHIVSGISIYTLAYATGTLIAMPTGPVERLAADICVDLATGGSARIVWIDHHRQTGGSVIRIKAHALGRQAPSRDLIVPDDHGRVVDGVLIPAGLLANGDTIVREQWAEVWSSQASGWTGSGRHFPSRPDRPRAPSRSRRFSAPARAPAPASPPPAAASRA